jgi:hypothetical protein
MLGSAPVTKTGRPLCTRARPRAPQHLCSLSWYVDDLELEAVRVVEEHCVVPGHIAVVLGAALDRRCRGTVASPRVRRPWLVTRLRMRRDAARRGSGRSPPATVPRAALGRRPGRRGTRWSRRVRPRPRRSGDSRAARGGRGRRAGCARSTTRPGRRGGRLTASASAIRHRFSGRGAVPAGRVTCPARRGRPRPATRRRGRRRSGRARP